MTSMNSRSHFRGIVLRIPDEYEIWGDLEPAKAILWRAQHVFELSSYSHSTFDGMFSLMTTKELAEFSELADVLLDG